MNCVVGKLKFLSMAAQHPESYIAYAFTRKNGPLEKFIMPWKDPEPRQIVVKVLACGICGR